MAGRDQSSRDKGATCYFYHLSIEYWIQYNRDSKKKTIVCTVASSDVNILLIASSMEHLPEQDQVHVLTGRYLVIPLYVITAEKKHSSDKA